MKTFLLFITLFLSVASITLAQTDSFDSTKVVIPDSPTQAFDQVRNDYLDMINRIRERTSNWLKAQEAAKIAATSNDNAAKILAVRARLPVMEDKIAILQEVIDLASRAEQAYNEAKGAVERDIEIETEQLADAVKRQRESMADIAKATDLMKRVEQILGSEEAIDALLANQELSLEDRFHVTQFKMEVESLMNEIEMQKAGMSTAAESLLELENDRLRLTLAYFELRLNIKKAAITQRSLHQIYQNDTAFLKVLARRQRSNSEASQGPLPQLEIPAWENTKLNPSLPEPTQRVSNLGGSKISSAELESFMKSQNQENP
jgi:hypothetical protein